MFLSKIPRSKRYGGKREESTGNSPKSESSIPAGIFRIFSGKFQLNPRIFLQDPVFFPAFSRRFLPDPDSRIIDLGLPPASAPAPIIINQEEIVGFTEEVNDMLTEKETIEQIIEQKRWI